MVGGGAADFEAAQDVLNAVGKTIVHVGPSGSGQTVKAANQLIVAVNIEVLGEAIAFLEAYGVDTDAALKVLGGGLAGSKVLDQKGQKMLDRNFDPGFRLALHHKDLGIVTSAAREANVAVPLGAVVKIFLARATGVYLGSDFYQRPPAPAEAVGPAVTELAPPVTELAPVKTGSVPPSRTAR